MKVVINDFVEDLNYKKIILYINLGEHFNRDNRFNNSLTCIFRDRLGNDRVNHLYRFDPYNPLWFYIENCDYEPIDMRSLSGYEYIGELYSDGYKAYELKYEISDDEEYIFYYEKEEEK